MGRRAVGRNQGGPSPRLTGRSALAWATSVGSFPVRLARGGVGRLPGQSVARACHLPLLSLSVQGVARLADVSLNNPVSISVTEEGPALSNPEGGGALDVSAPQTGDKLDSFAIPEGLDQYVTLVPSKLRLVSLVAFILQKCAVGLGSGPGAVEGAGSCVETHALSSQGVCVSVALTRVSPWSGAVGENQRAVTASVFGLGSALSIFPGTDAGAGRIAGGRHVLDVGQLWGPVLGFWGDS